MFPKRLIPGFLALLCLVGHLAGYAHTLFVEHTICAEHGEPVHSDGDAQDQHEHCAVLAHRREPVVLGAVAWVVPEPVLAGAFFGVCQAAFVAPSIASYLLAPKNSPPAFARA